MFLIECAMGGGGTFGQQHRSMPVGCEFAVAFAIDGGPFAVENIKLASQ